MLNATGASGSLRQTISQSGVQTFSVYVKQGTADAIEIDCSITGVSVKVDLSDGSEIVSGASTIDTNIESIGSSWYRISVTGSACDITISLDKDASPGAANDVQVVKDICCSGSGLNIVYKTLRFTSCGLFSGVVDEGSC